MSNSLWPRGLQHSRLPCPSPTPEAYSHSCPSSWWCHPNIPSFVIPFFSCLQSFPASGYFPMSQFFTSGGQSIGVSASVWFFPMTIQDWFPLGLIGWISSQSKGLSRVLCNTSLKASVLWQSVFFTVQLSQPYMTTRETIALTIWTRDILEGGKFVPLQIWGIMVFNLRLKIRSTAILCLYLNQTLTCFKER